MNRLESIKERANKTALHQQEWLENYRGDVNYLLQRLEIAQNALESVANAPAREIMRKYAEKALEQLKDSDEAIQP